MNIFRTEHRNPTWAIALALVQSHFKRFYVTYFEVPLESDPDRCPLRFYDMGLSVEHLGSSERSDRIHRIKMTQTFIES